MVETRGRSQFTLAQLGVEINTLSNRPKFTISSRSFNGQEPTLQCIRTVKDLLASPSLREEKRVIGYKEFQGFYFLGNSIVSNRVASWWGLLGYDFPHYLTTTTPAVAPAASCTYRIIILHLTSPQLQSFAALEMLLA